jgi:prevent-host-death family protein
MIKVTTSKARQEFARVLRKVKQGKRFLLEKHDKAVAAIVSVEDLALLEAIENRHDLEAARRALAEVAERGAIPWEQAEAELDLLDAQEEAQGPGI